MNQLYIFTNLISLLFIVNQSVVSQHSNGGARAEFGT